MAPLAVEDHDVLGGHLRTVFVITWPNLRLFSKFLLLDISERSEEHFKEVKAKKPTTSGQTAGYATCSAKMTVSHLKYTFKML